MEPASPGRDGAQAPPPRPPPAREGLLTLFLCGDVMTGRGIDQILPHPGDPRLWERHARDARAYVELAEAAAGPVPRPAGFSWPWGDALETLDEMEPEVRVINLETSITRRGDAAAGKPVHYRMNPQNLPCLTVARPSVCALANNHVLDFGYRGLADTLDALAAAKIRAAGAGHDARAARRPAVVPAAHGGRVIVFSSGLESSGIPWAWAAARGRPGVDLLDGPPAATAGEVAGRIRDIRKPGDVVVASLHWGSNWGYGVPPEHVAFAHRIIDGGADIVHGHSSHHPRPVEVYRGRLILYGCGDLINDYEGIGGYEQYRDDLRVLYFASLDPGTGELARLQMAVMRARRMRLRHAPAAERAWLRDALSRASRRFGSRIGLARDGMLTLQAGCP